MSLSAALVAVTAITGYRFIRQLYLDEAAGHISALTKIYSANISPDFLILLNLGKPSKPTVEYFHSLFNATTIDNRMEIFFINRHFQVLLHNLKNDSYGISEPDLLLHKNELENLEPGKSFSTMPFKGADGRWYLWGFARLSNDFYLGLKENAASFEKVENLSLLFWLIGLSGGVFSVALSIILARSISRPIQSLIKFSSEIGEGKFQSAVRPDVYGELGILANAMEKMKTDLKRQQQVREQMLAQIAHEIRNPLGGIELLSHLVKEDLGEDAKKTEYINRIIKEVAGLKELITVFLNFSKPKPSAPAWVNMKALFEEITGIFRPEFERREIGLFHQSQFEKIFFDREHLKQILINLITNSINAINQCGNIRIETALVNSQWIIRIIDDGAGIPSDRLNKIFEPFFSGSAEGTGLGLAICKKLAEENNASLTAMNDNEKGCIFTLSKEIINED